MKTITNNIVKNVVAIGYGSRLCGDDGVGQAVAEAIVAWNLPNVRAIASHQLTPEMVDILVTVDLAIFIDACPTDDSLSVRVYPIELAKSGSTIGHYCEPKMLLAIAQALYGYHPQAWLVTIPALDFSLGDRLSCVAQNGMTEALKELERLIRFDTAA
ncbi:MAG: hydrogenase maturation protease [Cyanosarcina radialis HA8281-LM2]|jgi:hydrogenase maturation protease|nr:hydrogenase maturation protease [Cyanosarcina radialis HA8281-LM2]